MSTYNQHPSGTLARTTTRRSFLKTVAAASAASSLLAMGRIAGAGRPLPNRETGTAPVIGGLSSFRSAPSAPKRVERRTPD